MKKLFVLSLAVLFMAGLCADARTVYDETGRNIIHDGTIRGQKREAQARAEQQKKLKAAAAAKLDYEAALKSLETPKPKTNFIQDQVKK